MSGCSRRPIIWRTRRADVVKWRGTVVSVEHAPSAGRGGAAASGGLCKRALRTCLGWRDRELEVPPYLAYLALFVLAAGREGDFASHAYYPRLWDLLGEPDTGRAPPSFDRMFDLWDDLET